MLTADIVWVLSCLAYDKYSMDINELESFKLSDAVKFHKELNPRLWQDNKLDGEVRDQLLLIAEDFVEYLGLSNLKVKDVTISGSNAAYSYTPHSDLDLHVLVDFDELPNNEVYQELFTAKKTLYNDAHDITVHGVPVELYVQDINQPVQSLGEYSIVYDKWIRFPKKRRANFDQAATKLKYEKLGDLIELALKSKDPKKVNDTLALIKRYRKSGLDKTGEFGPENLAYKAVRKQGLVQALYDLKTQLHAEKLSIEEDTGSIADMIKSSLGLKQFIVTEKGNDLYLDSIIVDKKDQGKGLGTKALKQLISYADQTGKRIILTPGLPNKEHGTTSRNRLVKFYKKFGFKENKGRSIDFAMGAGKMYRDPKGQLQEKEHKLLNKPTLSVPELAEKHGVSRMDIATQLDKGIKVELEHTRDRTVAREIALDHLAEDPKYYDKLASVELEEEQLDENAQESQLINLVSKKAAAVIFNMFRKNESKLMKILGPDMKRHNLEIWGIGAEKLGVPYVNDPILGSVLHRAKFRVANYVDPINRGRLASYDPSTHDVTVHFPAIMKSAGKFGYESEQYLAKIIAHELRHAVDNFKSRGKAFTTGKKAYPTLPYEINARFQEALMNMTMEFDRARKEGKTLDRKHLPQFIDSALEHNEISQFLPKTGSRYKRLANRAYKFFNAELENPKKEQPLSLGKRAINFILGKPTSSIAEETLLELADKPYPYREVKKTDNTWTYHFETADGNDYIVTVVIGPSRRRAATLGIRYGIEIHFELEQDGYTFDTIVNTGDSVRIFSTVANILLDAVKKIKPDTITILSKADEPSRVKLYSSLANRALKLLPEYEFHHRETGMAPNGEEYVSIDLAKKGVQSIKLGGSLIRESIAYHVTPTRNLRSIMKNGLRPQIGDRSSQLDGEVEGIFLFPSLSDVEAAVSSWLGDEFDEDEELSLLAVDITGLENNIVQGADYETIVNTVISPDRIKVDDSLLLEASGYIPSES